MLSLRNETKSEVRFLWVQLQLQALRRTDAADVERALEHLPSTLHETYDRILQEFSSAPPVIGRVRRVFESIAFAKERLSPKQMVEIYQIQFNGAFSLVNDTNHRVQDPVEFLLMRCPGIIEVAHFGTAHATVQFIHFSTKEYLLSSSLAASPLPISSYAFDDVSAHRTLAKICISALEMGNSLPGLRQYIKQHWSSHILPGPVAERLDPVLSRLLDSTSPAFLRLQSDEFHSSRDPEASPLHWAAYLGLTNQAKRLVSGGVDVDVDVLEPDGSLQHEPSYRDKRLTPLFYAAAAGHFDTVTFLVNHGADLVSPRRYDRIHVMHPTIRNGRSEIIDFLVKHGAAVSPQNLSGDTPLHYAGAYRPEVTLCLLGHGADVHCVNRFGNTPLHSAIDYGCSVKVLAAYLKHGADINCANGTGDTPLHYLARNAYGNKEDQIDFLVKHSAPVTIRNHNGDTPLHRAATASSGKNLADLLRHGANISPSNRKGETPLHYAVTYGHPEIIRLLLEAGVASVDAKTKRGSTPLHLALERRRKTGWNVRQYDKVVQLLLDHGATRELGELDDDGDKSVEGTAKVGLIESSDSVVEV